MTYDPSLRVLTVLELLQAHETVTGAELARTLEVSPRTVQRYIMRLQDLGIPVEGKRGVGGAYRLKAGFRLPPLMFTGDEALSLALGLLALQQLGLSDLTPAAGAARAKLARTLPAALRDTVQALEEAVQFDASPWVVNTDAGLLQRMLQAVREHHTARLAYTSHRSEATERRVDIYRVLHVDGRWYAAGLCHLRASLRVFRLDRIASFEVLDDAFEPPTDFDALALVRREQPQRKAYEVSVWLAAPPAELRGQVSMWYTDLCAEGAGTRLRGKREYLSSFAAFLLGLGVDFQIESPPELRAEFGKLAARCAAAQEGSSGLRSIP